MKTTYRLVLICLVLVTLGFGTIRLAELSHDSVFSKDDLLTAEAADLKATIVSAHLDVPVEPGKNVLWCGTFQLAYNEACSLVGEDLKFDTPSPVVDALNKKAFTKTDLDDTSYVALAGFVRDGIRQRIRRELDDKFEGRATPEFIPRWRVTPRPEDIIAYCYLFKMLEFHKTFERLDEPLVFAGRELPAFGIGPYKAAHRELYPQVVILDYKSEEDFVVELKTKSEGDRVILARVKPEETLGATVASVDRRAAAPGEPATPGDVLRVPKLNFDVTRCYDELEGKQLVTSNPTVAKDLVIRSALQNVRFQMDEQGVKLKSESHIAFGCAAERRPPDKRIMVFDQPFLIMLRRTDAKMPYFALWVDNPELLVK